MADDVLLDEFRAWMESTRGVAANSAKNYVSFIRNFLHDWRRKGDEAKALGAYLTRRIDDAPSGSSTVWKASVQHWCAWRDLPVPVIPKMKRRPAKLREALGPDELRAYHECVEAAQWPAVRAILHLLPLTGLRIHEVCKLRRDEYTRYQGVQGFRFLGKGKKERFVPATKAVQMVLEAYMPAAEPSEYLFPSIVYPERSMRTDTVRDHLRKLRDSDKWTPHVARHSFATRALDSGMDLVTLGGILGHSSVKTTAIYAHASPHGMASAMAKMPDPELPVKKP